MNFFDVDVSFRVRKFNSFFIKTLFDSDAQIGEHSKKYIDPNQPSKSIVTIGLGTALSAEILLLPIFDTQKAPILNRLFNGPMTAGLPATLLRNHSNTYIVTTRNIANEAGIGDLCTTEEDPKAAAERITSN